MAVNLEGNIIINGKVGSGFDSIMAQLHQMQSVAEMIGGPIRQWEEESVEIYRDYETNMLKARAAMSDQYDSYNELNKVMDTLDKQVQEWAANSVFHTSDFSNAVNNAAHAGWNLEQQLEGIPRAALLAQAGNMDLADGLSYLARALNVTGTDFEDSGVLVDQWVKASHLANLTIEDLGQSLERMGITAQFTDNTAELFTMLDTLAQTGVVGAQAGTLLRGTMLRLIAPTKKAREMMEELEVTQEEYNELVGDSEAIQKTNAALEKTGFSAYNSAGKMKPMMQIYDELYNSLVQIAGSEEDLLKDDTVNQILSTLFPTRTISGALAFLQGVQGGWHDLYNEIVDSEGAAEKDSETVMSGLMGAQELFLSKWEEFSRKVGEELSGPLETLYDLLGGVVDKLNALPEEQLSALVGGLTALAETGPLLGVGTGIYKFFTWLPGWGKAALFAAVGVGALVGYLNKVSELNFKEQFGDLDIDVEALTSYVEGLESKYKTEQEAVGVWKEAVDAALEDYTNLTAKLNENLLEDVLTGKQLDETEIGNLKQYGDDIVSSVIKGINTAKERDLNLLDVLFDDITDSDQMDALDMGFALDSAYYDSVLGQANAIGAELRAQLVDALKDGTLDENERQAIMATEERLNAIMKEINAYKDQVALNEQLYNAQHVSAESAGEYLKNLVELDRQAEETIEKNRAAAWAEYKTKFDWALETNTPIKFADGTVRKVTERDRDKFLNEMMDAYDAEQSEIHGQYAGLADVMFQTLFHDSKFGDAYNWLSGQVDSGNVTDWGNGVYGFDQQTYDDLTALSDEELSAMRTGVTNMTDSAGHFSDILAEFGDSPEFQRLSKILGSGDNLLNLLDNEIARRQAARENTPGGVDEYGRAATEHIDELTDDNALRKVLADMDQAVANGGYDLFSKQAEAYHQAIQRMDELNLDHSNLSTIDGWYYDYLYAHRNDSKDAMAEYLTATRDAENERLEKLRGEKAETEASITEHEAAYEEKDRDPLKNFTSDKAGDYAALYGGAWQKDGGLYGKSERLDVDISEAEANVKAIQSDLDALNAPDVTVGTELDSSEVDSWEPSDETLEVTANLLNPFSEKPVIEGPSAEVEEPDIITSPLDANAEEQIVEVTPELTELDASQLINLQDQIAASFESGGMTDALTQQIQQWEAGTEQLWKNLYGEGFDAAGTLQETFGNQDWYNQYLQLKAVVDTSDIESQLDGLTVNLLPRAETLAEDAASALQGQGVEVSVDGDTAELQATIDGVDGQTLLEYVNGDATNLSMTITDQDGRTLTENVHGDASSLAAVINSYNGKTITVNIKGNKMFAEGGRATEPSIFGEAGPEWAIPEAHSERTAQLLNAAREASGFTWGDIIGRFGGLNADPGHVTVNLSYAPTINAANADGVSEALALDKSRVERLVREAVQKAMSESKLHEELEVYA